MNEAQMLRLLQEYPLDDDEFEWKWFGTLKFPNPTTLRNAGKLLLQWRHDLEKYEGRDSLNADLALGQEFLGDNVSLLAPLLNDLTDSFKRYIEPLHPVSCYSNKLMVLAISASRGLRTFRMDTATATSTIVGRSNTAARTAKIVVCQGS
jgi:hypothetical protein